ncbi:tyrosine-type recombinase/integrase [Acidithiobacillus marinus]|uniref:tyrosine-type recombinase/integrase n=1 Tax=Acidithiobacillus marinus TaxID=187490 RepID=UPI001553728D|nr:tyrosine-type recombinase/integrase [Acidithiobacillus marinus]
MPEKNEIHQDFPEITRRIQTASTANTSKTYVSRIKGYLLWCRGHKIDPAQVLPDTIMDYLEHRNWGKSTKTTTMAALEALYEVMSATWNAKENPAYLASQQNTQKRRRFGSRGHGETRLPSTLDSEEEARFVATTHLLDHKGYNGIRPGQIMRFILGTGLRREEAVQVREQDLHLEGEKPYVRVIRGKGHKERTVPINPALREELAAFAAMRKALLSDSGLHHKTQKSLPFFCDKSGKGYEGSSVYYIMQRTLRSAGIEKWQSGPHVLRHTFATKQLQKGIPTAVVKLWMGHRDAITLLKTYEHVTTGEQHHTPA